MLWNSLFEDFAEINERRQAKRLPRVVRVYESNIIFHFCLLFDESAAVNLRRRTNDCCLFALRFYGPVNPLDHVERGQFI